MTQIFAKAETLRSLFADAGIWVGDLSTSINRNGDHSAYFETGFRFRIRVSDHDCNGDFRVAEHNWFADATAEEVAAFIGQVAANTARYQAQRAADDIRAAAARKEQAEKDAIASALGERRRKFYATRGIVPSKLNRAALNAARSAFATACANGQA